MLSIVAMACSQTTTTDYKTERDEVMKIHDVVMGDHSAIVNNQMKLDTLLNDLKGLKVKYPEVDTLQEKEKIKGLIDDLSKAENLMNDWMHKFEPDVSGKSNEESISYFKAEHVKILAVDSLYKKEIKLSDEYLSKFGK